MTLPHGWTSRRFDQLGELCSGSTPSSSRTEFWDGATVWVTPTDLSRLNTPYLHDSAKHITERGLRNCSARLLPPGSIVLSSRAPIGYVAIPTVPFCTNQGCKSIALHNSYHSEFVYYAVTAAVPRLKRLGEGTTFAEISKSSLAKAEVVLPIDKAEQAKIAEVLSTVDRAIEQTEALIAKQQRIKTGLTQDLLTRGIDEHGNIRSEKTHKFKDSPLGRIPVEWESRKLCQVLVQRPRNGLYKTASLIGRGTLLVGQTSFTQDRRLDFSLCRRAVVSPSEIETFGLVFGDILVTRVFATVDGIGQPVLVDSPPEPAVYESNMLLLRPSASMIDSLLLFTWLRSAATRRRVLCSVNASNQVSVNQTVLNSLPVPVPSISEQKRISQALGQIDAAVRCTDVSLQKLRLLKTGLMQDLLTGERRVTALLGSPKELVDA